MLRPAADGTGVIAGGAVRVVLELAGVKNAFGKQLGTSNPLNNARAAIEGIKAMRTFQQASALLLFRPPVSVHGHAGMSCGLPAVGWMRHVGSQLVWGCWLVHAAAGVQHVLHPADLPSYASCVVFIVCLLCV
jgi:hypothetical protein